MFLLIRLNVITDWSKLSLDFYHIFELVCTGCCFVLGVWILNDVSNLPFDLARARLCWLSIDFNEVLAVAPFFVVLQAEWEGYLGLELIFGCSCLFIYVEISDLDICTLWFWKWILRRFNWLCFCSCNYDHLMKVIII